MRSNQPTVGRHIDALEAALGVKLFQRHKQGLVLTHEGALIREQARHMRDGAESIRRLAADGSREPGGSVRLAVPEGLCNEILIPALERFYRRHPGIRLILKVSPHAADLTRGEADIAIRLFRPREPDLVARLLAHMELGLYASRGYLKAHGRPASAAGLGKHRLIGYGEDLAGLKENRWLLGHGRPEHVVLASDSTASRLRATQAGLGISIQPCLIADRDRQLVRLLKTQPLPAHPLWITYHKDLRHTARARAVVEFLSGLVGR
jgi:DNA-binding transcriptional LysR family regulator